MPYDTPLLESDHGTGSLPLAVAPDEILYNEDGSFTLEGIAVERFLESLDYGSLVAAIDEGLEEAEDIEYEHEPVINAVLIDEDGEAYGDVPLGTLGLLTLACLTDSDLVEAIRESIEEDPELTEDDLDEGDDPEMLNEVKAGKTLSKTQLMKRMRNARIQTSDERRKNRKRRISRRKNRAKVKMRRRRNTRKYGRRQAMARKRRGGTISSSEEDAWFTLHESEMSHDDTLLVPESLLETVLDDLAEIGLDDIDYDVTTLDEEERDEAIEDIARDLSENEKKGYGGDLQKERPSKTPAGSKGNDGKPVKTGRATPNGARYPDFYSPAEKMVESEDWFELTLPEGVAEGYFAYVNGANVDETVSYNGDAVAEALDEDDIVEMFCQWLGAEGAKATTLQEKATLAAFEHLFGMDEEELDERGKGKSKSKSKSKKDKDDDYDDEMEEGEVDIDKARTDIAEALGIDPEHVALAVEEDGFELGIHEDADVEMEDADIDEIATKAISEAKAVSAPVANARAFGGRWGRKAFKALHKGGAKGMVNRMLGAMLVKRSINRAAGKGQGDKGGDYTADPGSKPTGKVGGKKLKGKLGNKSGKGGPGPGSPAGVKAWMAATGRTKEQQQALGGIGKAAAKKHGKKKAAAGGKAKGKKLKGKSAAKQAVKKQQAKGKPSPGAKKKAGAAKKQAAGAKKKAKGKKKIGKKKGLKAESADQNGKPKAPLHEGQRLVSGMLKEGTHGGAHIMRRGNTGQVSERNSGPAMAAGMLGRTQHHVRNPALMESVAKENDALRSFLDETELKPTVFGNGDVGVKYHDDKHEKVLRESAAQAGFKKVTTSRMQHDGLEEAELVFLKDRMLIAAKR